MVEVKYRKWSPNKLDSSKSKATIRLLSLRWVRQTRELAFPESRKHVTCRSKTNSDQNSPPDTTQGMVSHLCSDADLEPPRETPSLSLSHRRAQVEISLEVPNEKKCCYIKMVQDVDYGRHS